MKVLVVGAGPAGLYFGYLARRAHPAWQIRVLEQNPADATFGFGVVFSDKALEFLRADDPATYGAITPQLEAWIDLVVVHRGERRVIDGIGFAAIGRLHFLRLMQRRLAAVGVTPEYGRALGGERFEDYDLVVAADGANSAARRARDFGTRITHCTNKFAWYGTPRRFEKLTQAFLRSEHGVFNVHHYPHAPDMSTFVVECDTPTWERAGFAAMGEDETRAYLERVYAPVLQGAPLVSNKSVWRNFPNVRNERWSVGNLVLIGDALRTAHFSIGSGTRLAMEDAIALVKAFEAEPNVNTALRKFEEARRPIVDKLVAAADASGAWYDRFAEHMNLSPRDFAWSYIQRSGRIDPGRLAQNFPEIRKDLMLFPTTLVGSYPQPDWLIDRKKLAGRFPPRVRAQELWLVEKEFLNQAQDDATVLAIRAQERAGLDIVTDGEIRRESYSNRFATALEGIDIDNPGTALDRSGHPNPVPRIVGKIRRKHAVEVEDLKFLKRHTTKQTKITVPGPFTMSQQAQNDYYPSPAEAAMDYAVAVNAEIRDLFAAGADIVQIDEPYMQARPDKAREYGLKALNRALDGISGTTAVHICFGYAAIIHERPSGYSFLPELAGSPVRQVSIETAQSKLDCAVLASLSEKKIMVGCIDLADMAIETPEKVAERLRKALKYVKPQDVIVAPDCGLKYLPREVADAKMRAMVEGAKLLRAEYSRKELH